jgi:hypothetical protein
MTATIDYDAIAAQIHQFYCDLAKTEGSENEFPMPFAELPEFMKADNRAAARRIAQVLALAGLRLSPRDGQPWNVADQKAISDLIEQNIDLLAEGEHDGWVLARLRQGWVLGPCKDVANRQSHLLVSYAELPSQIAKKQEHERSQNRPPSKTLEKEVESEKEKDRNSVRNYVRIVAQTHYRIDRAA